MERIDLPVDQGQSRAAAEDVVRPVLTDSVTAQIASEAASLVLAAQKDSDIDLTGANGAAAALSKSLRDAYLATMAPLLGALPSASRETAAVLAALMERLATLEADLFLIKSCLAGNQRFILGEGNRYVDPLMLLDKGSETDSPAAAAPMIRQLKVPLGPAVLGQGWHPVETRPDGSYWRWSGPGLRATLLLPCLGPGGHCINWTFEVLDRKQLDGLAISVNGGRIVQPEITWLSEKTGAASLVADIPAQYRSSYLFLEIRLGAALNPVDLGWPGESRKQGMGIGAVEIERCSSRSAANADTGSEPGKAEK